MISNRATRLSRTAALIAGLAILATALGGCEPILKTVDKARMKLFGIRVTDPEPESAEWVLLQVLQAALEKDEEVGWERFQKVLHSSERTTQGLQNWHEMGWKRIRKQADDYLDDDGSFKIVDFKDIMSSTEEVVGLEFYVESVKKEMPTPCAVYIDEEAAGHWRVRRCSF